MKIKTSNLLISLITAFLCSTSIHAQEVSPTVAELQTLWAKANYQLKGDEQLSAFEQLLAKTEAASHSSPNDPATLIWSGIIKSTIAGVKRGLGALKYAKASKADLEKAIDLDPQALNGSAYTSLGTLYFKVPSWPIGFGDKKKANKLLQKALEINPEGIDPNYFYADYLRNRKKYQTAYDYFQKALRAAPRAGRELADQGRRNEIDLALKDIADKL